MTVSRAVMQSDGNFVIYGYPDPLWATNTYNHEDAFIVLQDDGSLVVYGTTPIWTSIIEDK
jgi:exopolysaccharide biosynthesis protein